MANYGGEDEDMDGMTFHDRLEFWGMEVPPNKKVDVVFGETDEELVHLTQVALGDKPGDEPAAVSLVVKGKETFIGTLRKAKCDQFSLDLALGETFSIKHTGKSAVYVTGWRQMLTSASDEDLSDEEDEEEEEEEEEAPPAAAPVPKKASAGGVKPAASNGAARPEKQGLVRGAAPPANPAPAKPVPVAVKKPPVAADSDSEDDDDEDDDDDDDDDVPAPPVSLGKRPADRQLMSPAPKKTPMAAPPSAGKTPLGSKTPATPAAEKGVSTPGSVAEFEAQIVAFLKKHGRTGMSALGGKVKKPGNVPKLNAFVKERPHLFKLIGDQVELVKKK